MGEIFAFYIQKRDQMYFIPNKTLSAFVLASNRNYIYKILLALYKYHTEKPGK